MTSIMDKIKQTRATIMTKRKELVSNIKSRTGIAGLGVDEMLDVTLEDISNKGLLDTISSKVKVQRARIRQKVGIRSQILPDISNIFKGERSQIRQRIYAPRESKTVPPATATQKPAPTAPPAAGEGGQMDLRIMQGYKVRRYRRTM